MSLDEIFRDEPTVSHDEAIAEILKHGASIPEFYAELGLADEYNGTEVLGWLGYRVHFLDIKFERGRYFARGVGPLCSD